MAPQAADSDRGKAWSSRGPGEPEFGHDGSLRRQLTFVRLLKVGASSHLRTLSSHGEIVPHRANNLYQSVQICLCTREVHYPYKYLLSNYCRPISFPYSGGVTVDRREKKVPVLMKIVL